MSDRFITRTAAVFSILVIASEIAAVAIGISRGVPAPTAIHFGDAQHLLRLSQNHSAAVLPWSLALAGPYLSIPVGVGWYQVLKGSGSGARLGVVMFYVSMAFVVTGEALRVSMVGTLPAAFAAASETDKSAILAFGATLDMWKETLFSLGQMLGFGLGQLAFGLAILRTGQVPRVLGWISVVSAVCLGWLTNPLKMLGAPPAVVGPTTGVGLLAFAVWIVAMAVILFRWQPEEFAASSVVPANQRLQPTAARQP